MIRRRWFLRATGDDRSLLQNATTMLASEKISTDRELLELLAHIRHKESTNLATALFYQYLLQHKKHGAFIKQVQAISPSNNAPQRLPNIVIVPGLFAAHRPDLGGDGALLKAVATQLGFAVSTAPTDGQASLSENAAVLHRYLQSVPFDQFWLVSISRGSADVKFMLNQYKDASYHHNLRRWISVSGIVTGTPLFRGLAKRPVYSTLIRAMSTLQGISAQLVQELQNENPHWCESCDRYPFDITHVMPVPLDWHVTSPVIPRYSRLQHLGPTDGIIMLAETLSEQGHIYPIWGADHMLRVPNLSDHLYQLICFYKDGL